MNKTFLKACAFSILFLVLDSVSAQTAFLRTIGGSKGDNNYAIKRTPDGGYITVGYTESYGRGNQDVMLVKTNGLGEVQWSKAYGGTGDETGWSIVVAPDSGYVIAGTTNSNSTSNANGLVFKTDRSGNVVWATQLASDSVEDAYNVINARTGGYYVTGFVRTDTIGDDAFVAKFDNSGRVLWYIRCGSPGDEEAYGIAEDLNGNILICGMTNYDSITNGGASGYPGNSDMFLAKITSSGSLVWMKTFGTVENDVAWDVIVDRDRYVMAGWTKQNGNDDDVALVITDSTGRLQSSNAFGTMGTDKAFNVVAKPGPEYNVVGYADASGNDRSVFWLTADSKGSLKNFQMYGGPARDGHWPTDVVVDRDGGFTILSTSRSFNSAGDDDWMLLKVDQGGNAACNSQLEFLSPNGMNLSSRNFGASTIGFRSGGMTLTTTNISNIRDSTICCKLKAEVSSSSVSICSGDQISLGANAISGYQYKWTSASGKFTSTSSNPTIRPTEDDTYKLVVSANDKACRKDSATITVRVVDRLALKFVQDTSFCDGESVSVKVFGGLASYNWKGNHVSSSDSTITVSKTDTIVFTGLDRNACIYRDTLYSTANPLPLFNLGRDTTICENASITFVGPANMKTYRWNNGAASTQSFTTSREQKHTLDVVDQNGCRASDEINLFTKPYSTFSLGPDTTFCEGSTYRILGPGALSGYIWNGTPSTQQDYPVTQPGTYHLTAFNSFNCPFSDTITLSWRPVPTIDLGADRGFCRGEGFYLVAPANMASYTWHNGSGNDSFFVSGGGLYYVEIKDSTGCVNIDSINITEYALPQVTLGADTTICLGDSILLDPGAFSTYRWTTGANTRSIYAKTKALYGVTITDANGCSGSAQKDVNTKDCGTGSILQLGLNEFEAYPNPARSALNLRFSSTFDQELRVEISELSGKIIQSAMIPSMAGENMHTLKLNGLSSGVYLVHLHNTHHAASFRLMVE
ncbi:MAG: T9SS type A sorting domain-containing protein [Flavobacteriales bacterium]|nr:T9SS type A sorting domain-containing protein [Flavobacteriales bacterium]